MYVEEPPLIDRSISWKPLCQNRIPTLDYYNRETICEFIKMVLHLGTTALVLGGPRAIGNPGNEHCWREPGIRQIS